MLSSVYAANTVHFIHSFSPASAVHKVYSIFMNHIPFIYSFVPLIALNNVHEFFFGELPLCNLFSLCLGVVDKVYFFYFIATQFKELFRLCHLFCLCSLFSSFPSPYIL